MSYLKQTLKSVLLAVCLMLPMASCQQTAPPRHERAEIASEAQTQLAEMLEKAPRLEPLLADAAGYAVFPEVGKGGFVVGGAFGRGMVYERGGKFLGYATISQASIGGVVGGQMYAQLVVFQTRNDLDSFTQGQNAHVSAQATAIAITEGAGDSTNYENGVAVFIFPRGGLMADASLSGQEFRFVSADEVDRDSASAQVPLD